jgi:hypothetical protein
MSNRLRKGLATFAGRPNAQALALAALGALAIALQWRQPYAREFLGFDLGLVILSVCLPYVTRSVFQSLEKLPGLIAAISANGPSGEKWAPASKRTGRVALWISGLTLAAFGAVTSWVFGVPWSGAALAVSALWLFLVLFGYGRLGYLYGLHMYILWDLRKLEVKCQIFEWPREEIQDLYQVYSGLLAWGAGLYVIAIVSVWSSPGVWLVDRFGMEELPGSVLAELGTGSPWLVLESAWVFPAGMMVIFFFLLFHLRCHKLLVQCRDQAVRQLGRLASRELEAWSSESKPERLATVDRFLGWKEKIHGERVWPIDLRAAIATLTTVLIPTIKTLMEFLG